MPSPGWTYEDEQELQRLRKQEMPIRKIARVMGRSTGAISGKLSRMGRSNDDLSKERRHRNSIAATSARKRKKVIAAPSEPLPQPQAYDVGRKFIEDLEAPDCRFPVDKERGFWRFCALEAVPGLPYCAEHARRCYKPPKVTQPEKPATADNVTPIKESV